RPSPFCVPDALIAAAGRPHRVGDACSGGPECVAHPEVSTSPGLIKRVPEQAKTSPLAANVRYPTQPCKKICPFWNFCVFIELKKGLARVGGWIVRYHFFNSQFFNSQFLQTRLQLRPKPVSP